MVLNLIPIPPLDGGRIAVSLLPNRLAYRFAMIEPYGFIIIIALLVTRVLGVVIGPLVMLGRDLIYALFRSLLQCSLIESCPACARPAPCISATTTACSRTGCRLQHEYPCLFFVADWHALTTHYEDAQVIEQNVWDMVIDWLAAGVDPAQATLFIQSRVPEHAELHLLLSMITPLGWLERVPTYKDQQEKLTDKDLSTYGFLGYPLLQGADILIYRATLVPVGEDQVPHIEFTREIARRFNHIYGREPGFEEKAEAAVKKLGGKRSKLYRELRTRFQEQGDGEALEAARALLDEAQNLSHGRPRAPVRLPRRRRQDDPVRAAGAADRGLEDAGAGRAEDVEVLQQHDQRCAKMRRA